MKSAAVTRPRQSARPGGRERERERGEREGERKSNHKARVVGSLMTWFSSKHFTFADEGTPVSSTTARYPDDRLSDLNSASIGPVSEL